MRVWRLWWCLPVAVFCAADGLITLCGQPATYWSGGFAQVCEGNPLAAWLLTVHPLAFAAAGVPYLLGVVGTVLALPRRWAAIVSLGMASAHAFAVGVWCQVLFSQPLLPLAGVALALVALAAMAAWRGRERAEPTAAAAGVLPGMAVLGLKGRPEQES